MKRTKSERVDPIPDVYVADSGDYYGEETYYEGGETASCRDVILFCFKRSFLSWTSLIGYLSFYIALAYCYYFGIALLVAAFEVFAGCQIGSLLEQVTNPVTCVLVGMLVGSITQSSSAASVVTSLVVGDALTIKQGIYIAMGSNLGNTVTNSMLVLGHIMNKGELERVVAGVSVNDFFLLFGLFIFVPLEAASGMLYHLSGTLVPQNLSKGYQWTGFTENFITPLVKRIIIPNKYLMSDIVAGNVESCNSVYPVTCDDGIKTYDACDFGTIMCNNNTGSCPLLFNESINPRGDLGSGAIAIAMALGIIAVCLFCMVKLMRKMLIETPAQVIVSVTNINGYLSMFLGCLVTALVGNSSLAESLLNPFLSSGIIELEQMLPWSLGCNIGMASLLVLQSAFSGKTGYFHVALANLFFIVFSTALWYPLPYLRKFVLHSSLILGIITRKWRIVSFLYLFLTFFGLPLALLRIIALLQSENTGQKAGGIICLIAIGLIGIPILVWWHFGSGRSRFIEFFEGLKGQSVYYDDDDNSSISESEIGEDTTIEGGSSVGGYEVRPKDKKDPAPKGILRNRTGDVNVFGRDNPKSKQQSKKRLRKTKGNEESDDNACCQAVENCGVGA